MVGISWLQRYLIVYMTLLDNRTQKVDLDKRTHLGANRLLAPQGQPMMQAHQVRSPVSETHTVETSPPFQAQGVPSQPRAPPSVSSAHELDIIVFQDRGGR